MKRVRIFGIASALAVAIYFLLFPFFPWSIHVRWLR